MHGLHGSWAFAAVVCTGLVGAWGLGLAVTRRPAGHLFRWATGAAVTAMLLQVAFGLVLLQSEQPGNGFHVFYGIVIVFTLAFAYIFRARMARRPAGAWGILLLFIMGLGLRAWANVGG